MTHDSDERSKRIRDLNDAFRRTFIGGTVLCTRDVLALPDATRREILSRVRSFDAFTPDNDPYGEHDFGAIDTPDHRVFFKIDYYLRDMESGSPNPSDPTITSRVMTIMLAEEY